MRKIYGEYFSVPKHGKIREKVMMTRLFVTIVVMLICLVSLAVSAYAHFSGTVTSGPNFIKAANFEAIISIGDVSGSVALTADGKYRVAALEKDKVYTVKLKIPTDDSSAKTGFCVISDEYNSRIYHTQQLGTDLNAEGGSTAVITFTLRVSEDVRVYIFSHWGTSTNYVAYQNNSDNYIRNGSDIFITVPRDEESTLASENDNEANTEDSDTSAPSADDTVYTVQSGDTLSEIAERFGLSIDEIAAYNKIDDPRLIYAGQKIYIPASVAGSTENTDPSEGDAESDADSLDEDTESNPERDEIISEETSNDGSQATESTSTGGPTA